MLTWLQRKGLLPKAAREHWAPASIAVGLFVDSFTVGSVRQAEVASFDSLVFTVGKRAAIVEEVLPFGEACL